jgi:hypothetical protein
LQRAVVCRGQTKGETRLPLRFATLHYPFNAEQVLIKVKRITLVESGKHTIKVTFDLKHIYKFLQFLGHEKYSFW